MISHLRPGVHRKARAGGVATVYFSTEEGYGEAMQYSVYVVRNAQTGKCYVGCTRDLRKRLREHKLERPQIFRGDQWAVEILEVHADLLSAEQAEVRWIKELDAAGTGYNRQSGGRKGARAHPEDVEAMRLGRLGRKRPAAAVEKTAAANRGRRHTEDAKARMRAAQRVFKVKPDPTRREGWREHQAAMQAARLAKPAWNKGKKCPLSENAELARQERVRSGSAAAAASLGWKTKKATNPNAGSEAARKAWATKRAKKAAASVDPVAPSLVAVAEP